MKSFRNALIVCTLLGIAGAVGAQVNLPDPTVPGSTPDSAVRLVTTSDVMVDRFIRRWLRAHYPDWDAEPHEITEIGMQRYAVVRISPRNNSNVMQRQVYFRLTSSMHDDDDTGTPFGF
jgi:hypothetical protein